VTKSHRLKALLLLAAAVGLAALGQFYFFRRREYLWDGVVFHALAAICFLFAWRLGQPDRARSSTPRSWPAGEWLREHSISASLIGAGLFFSAISVLLSWDRPPDQSTGDVVALWLCGIGLTSLAVLWPAGARPRLTAPVSASGAARSAPLQEGVLRRYGLLLWRRPQSIVLDPKRWLGCISRSTWLEAATVAGLTGSALLLRVAALDTVPFTLGGDEAWHGLLARQVLRGELRNPFSIGYMSMPSLFYWPLSWSLQLVGNNVLGLRLPAALIGTATVVVLYFFARELWGRRTALLSALFLATYDYHIHYSRLGANNIWDPLFIMLALWALYHALAKRQVARDGNPRASEALGDQGSYRSFLLAGLVMGLSLNFYTGARLLPFLVLAFVAFVWFQRKRHIELLGLHLVLLFLAFLIAAGPALGLALTHPNEWNARINQVGIIQSGWLAREPGLTGKSTLQILAEQFLRSAGAFHVFTDRTAWYGADRPLLNALTGIFAMLGMAWAIAHWRDRRYFLVLTWFWSVIITGGMLTESPPSSQRLVIAIPAVALLVTTGLEQTVELAGRLLEPRRAEWKGAVAGVLLLTLALASVRYYFLEYTPARRYGSENGETATMIGYYLQTLDADYHAYFFGAPRIYWSFGTMTFLAPRIPGQDVTEPLTAPPDFVDTAHSAVFILLPERSGELVWIEQAFPGGQLEEFRDTSGRLRFTAYELAHYSAPGVSLISRSWVPGNTS
jgi:4-amino-4-deoxy-L-arabinose transferase-like glycosyltransferase